MATLRIILSGIISAVGLVWLSPAVAEAPEMQVEVVSIIEPQDYAESLMGENDWTPADFICLVKLWEKESHWNHKANNPTSSAYGIAQLLGETSKDPARQIRQGLKYLKHRYDSICSAWEFSERKGWY